jgi:hypothetical protein
MTNEEQKEAGTEAFPSLSLSLFLSFFFLLIRKKKSFHQSIYVHFCMSNENFSPITINVCSFSFLN